MILLKTLKSKKAEAQVSIGIKIIIGVVVGALVLGGLWLLFAGDNGVMSKLKTEVNDMMGYTQELRFERIQNESSGTYSIRYSYDGKHWNEAQIPDYGASATVEKVIGNDAETNNINAALVRDGTTTYIITTTDGGITWNEKMSFTAKTVTHFYFGTSANLPSTSGSFSGEKFVCRYGTGGSTYYTIVSDGTTWKQPTWSDLIPLN